MRPFCRLGRQTSDGKQVKTHADYADTRIFTDDLDDIRFIGIGGDGAHRFHRLLREHPEGYGLDSARER